MGILLGSGTISYAAFFIQQFLLQFIGCWKFQIWIRFILWYFSPKHCFLILIFPKLYAPRILQGALAGLGDWYLYKLSNKNFGSSVAKYAVSLLRLPKGKKLTLSPQLLCQVFSWFTFYCTVRTYSNSLESILVTIALYYFPTHSASDSKHRCKSFCCLSVFCSSKFSFSDS